MAKAHFGSADKPADGIRVERRGINFCEWVPQFGDRMCMILNSLVTITDYICPLFAVPSIFFHARVERGCSRDLRNTLKVCLPGSREHSVGLVVVGKPLEKKFYFAASI